MNTMDKKVNLKKLFVEQPLCMIGIVICIAVIIYFAVRIINVQLKINNLKSTDVPMSQSSQISTLQQAQRIASVETNEIIINL